jgi:hypothetical protein
MSDNPTLQTPGIKMLSSEFIQKLFINTQLGAILGTVISLVISSFDTNNNNITSYIVVYFVVSFNLIDSILREKNLFYKLKPGFLKELLIFVVVSLLGTITFFPLLILGATLLPDLSIFGKYLFVILLIFIPLTVAYFGSKLKWI